MNYLKPFALLMGIFVFANAAIEISDAQVTVTDRFIMVEASEFGYDIEIGHDFQTNDIEIEFIDRGWPDDTRIFYQRIPWRPNFHWIVVMGSDGNDSVTVRSDISWSQYDPCRRRV